MFHAFSSWVGFRYCFRQLLKSPSVLFAGYKVPHPLEPHFILKVQTDGSIPPSQALQESCQQLIALIANLQQKFDKEFELKEIDEGLGTGGGVGTGGVGLGPYGETLGARGVGDYLDFGGS